MSKSGKGIGLFGVIFFVIASMVGFDGLSATASIGPSVFGWWLVIILLFLIPNLLMISELGSSFPSDGAVYDWARTALGPKQAARVGWYYWINVPFWIPAVYLIAAGILSELVWPDMPVWIMCMVAIVLVWATVLIANASTDLGSAVAVVGGIAKVGVLLALIGGGLYHAINYGSATTLNLETMRPRFDAGFLYAPTLVYLIVGAETVACLGGALRNPGRNLPLGLLMALILIIALYSFAIAGKMIAIPPEELSLVGGITQTFGVLFGTTGLGGTLSLLLSAVAVIALFATIVPWMMASSRAAAEGAHDGELPEVFGRTNAVGSPVGANVMTGLTATAALFIYGLVSNSADDLFWNLFAFSSFLLFMTYFFLLASFIKLRLLRPDAPRPFKVPGGMVGAWIVVLSQGLVLTISCVVFVFPGLSTGDVDLVESAPILIGIMAAIGLVEFSIRGKTKPPAPTKIVSVEGA